MRQQIEVDIDAHLDRFNFTASRPDRVYVRDVHKYFEDRRPFYADSLRMITDDYRKGQGYNGYLKEGAQAFFNRAVEAVADTWFTVLRVEADPNDVPPSKTTVTWYLVAEIRYLLLEKKNFYQATQTYQNFEKAGTNMPEAFEKVGDLFYAFGAEEAQQRGVREWRLAYDMPGADRRDIGKKLSEHYIKVGEALLASSRHPGASDQDLPNALNAFTQALAFDQTNDVAASRINETNVAISERRARGELDRNIIASGERVMVQAEKVRLGGDFGNAITTYNQALGLFQAIDDEFTNLAATAKESTKEINKNITDIINEVLDATSDLIDKGDKAVDEHRFEEAISIYEQVPAKVSVIPGDESTTHGKEKADIIALSKKKIDDAKLAKSRWEETERVRKAAAEAAAKAAAK